MNQVTTTRARMLSEAAVALQSRIMLGGLGGAPPERDPQSLY
jgi:hypothetical protein